MNDKYENLWKVKEFQDKMVKQELEGLCYYTNTYDCKKLKK